MNETAWLEGNPYGYTEAVFGDGQRGGDRTDGYPQLQTGAKTLLMTNEQNFAAPDYNRVDAWTNDQHLKSHEKEWTQETAAIT